MSFPVPRLDFISLVPRRDQVKTSRSEALDDKRDFFSATGNILRSSEMLPHRFENRERIPTYRFHDAEKGSQDGQSLPTADKTNAEGEQAPSGAQQAEPVGGAEPFDQDVAGNFAETVADVEDENCFSNVSLHVISYEDMVSFAMEQ